MTQPDAGKVPDTVHLLMQGYALCGMPGLPGDWEPGQLWVSIEDTANAREVNCPACRLARRLIGFDAVDRPPDPVGRPTDEILVELLAIFRARRSGAALGPPFPDAGMIALLEELIEHRALASGVLEEMLNEGAKNDGIYCIDRPTDVTLRTLAESWRRIVLKKGAACEVKMPVMALLTLAVEILELRKAPRA